MKFKTQIFTHFDRCDLAGIVFFGNYAAFAHQVIEQFLPTLGIEWQTWFLNPAFAVPIRKLDVEYFKPLYAGRMYDAVASIVALGESSLTFAVEFSEPGGDVCTKVQSVHVMISVPAKKKMSIPADLRAQLERGLSASK